MKVLQILFASVLLGGILVSCSSPLGPSGTTPDGNKTYVAFDNSQGECTVIVFDDPRRRESDIVETVAAGASSVPKNWTAPGSCLLWFSWRFAVPGAEGNTLSYWPQDPSKNQVSVRIDADRTTTVKIPRLEDVVAPGELLGSRSFLVIQNSAPHSFRLLHGSSPLTAENIGNAVVNAGERAFYSLEGGAAASAYTLLAGTDRVPFPPALPPVTCTALCMPAAWRSSCRMTSRSTSRRLRGKNPAPLPLSPLSLP